MSLGRWIQFPILLDGRRSREEKETKRVGVRKAKQPTVECREGEERRGWAVVARGCTPCRGGTGARKSEIQQVEATAADESCAESGQTFISSFRVYVSFCAHTSVRPTLAHS